MAPRRSRFRWLTFARIVAASVLALAFTATVVVVVLTACLGADNVLLSVTHGHIQSAHPLWRMTDFSLPHLWRQRVDNIPFYAPANELTLWVSMNAHNPTRANATVCFRAVHVFDMPYAPSFDGMVHIVTVNNTVTTGNADKPCKTWSPRHPGSTSMQLDRWITVDQALMLCYVSQKYGGVNYFTVMLKVEMTIYPEDGAPENHTDTHYHDHYCWPVTIGNTQSIRSEAVTCKRSDAVDYASNASDLNACDHLTWNQRFICSKWGEVPISCDATASAPSARLPSEGTQDMDQPGGDQAEKMGQALGPEWVNV